ncbi:cyclin-dependent kinase inhibitor 1-like isoform X2 [Malania oleifera]|uniref:cyclin-dependent kinase inhibitor 1-like isoform X2 n=1 Tax=Malania oleifera TaxID=397392 RepID=UPI0025ADFCE2|nr:cyclin-dependent kinase inhibitor 1-like isoform X2 [Malania oleifera]
MGKYMRKSKGIGEVAVMELAHEVGVRTRARALAMAAASVEAAKRRRAVGGELRLSSSCIHLRSRRRVVIKPETENSVSLDASGSLGRIVREDHRSSPSSERMLASCCSSNGSSELVKERVTGVDLEDEAVGIETPNKYFDCRERETTPSSELRAESEDMESTARPSEGKFRPRSTAKKMPSESEIEEFFATAEKDLQKQFTEKYNYDIVKDVPLEGRYEWVQLVNP